MGSNPEYPDHFLGKVYSPSKGRWVLAMAKTANEDDNWLPVAYNTSYYQGMPVYWFSGDAKIEKIEEVEGYVGPCPKDMGYNTSSSITTANSGNGEDNSTYWVRTCATGCLACGAAATNQAHSANGPNDVTLTALTYPAASTIKHKTVNRIGKKVYRISINGSKQEITVLETTASSREYVPQKIRVKSNGRIEDTIIESDTTGKITVYYYFDGIKSNENDYDLSFESND